MYHRLTDVALAVLTPVLLQTANWDEHQPGTRSRIAIVESGHELNEFTESQTGLSYERVFNLYPDMLLGAINTYFR